jgi:hypothetical protein
MRRESYLDRTVVSFNNRKKNVSPVTYTHPFHSNEIEREKWIKEKSKAGLASDLMKRIALERKRNRSGSQSESEAKKKKKEEQQVSIEEVLDIFSKNRQEFSSMPPPSQHKKTMTSSLLLVHLEETEFPQRQYQFTAPENIIKGSKELEKHTRLLTENGSLKLYQLHTSVGLFEENELSQEINDTLKKEIFDQVNKSRLAVVIVGIGKQPNLTEEMLTRTAALATTLFKIGRKIELPLYFGGTSLINGSDERFNEFMRQNLKMLVSMKENIEPRVKYYQCLEVPGHCRIENGLNQTELLVRAIWKAAYHMKYYNKTKFENAKNNLGFVGN